MSLDSLIVRQGQPKRTKANLERPPPSDLQAIQAILQAIQVNRKEQELTMTAAIKTSVILDEFSKKIDINTEYTISELKKVLTEVYKDLVNQDKQANKKQKVKQDNDADKADKPEKVRKTRTKRERDENGEIIKKRPPSAYNIFIKEQSAIIKADNPDLDSKAIFKMAIDLWNQKKAVAADPTDSDNDA